MLKNVKKSKLINFILVFSLLFSNLIFVKNANAEVVPELLITEICYNSKSAAPFVEIYNATDSDKDLSKYTLWRSSSTGTTKLPISQVAPNNNLIIKPRSVNVISLKAELNAFNSTYSSSILENTFFKAPGTWGGSGFVALTPSTTANLEKTSYSTNADIISYAEYTSMLENLSYQYNYTDGSKAMKLVATTATTPTPGSVGANQVPPTTGGLVVPIENITINGNVAIEAGNKLSLVVGYTPSDTTEKAVTWDSLDKTVATVNSNGEVQAIKEGQTTIKVVSKIKPNILASVNVNVSPVSLKNIKDARNLSDGTMTCVEGTVTKDSGDSIFIQDETAGLVIYFKGLDLNAGDKVKVTGRIKIFYGLVQLIPQTSVAPDIIVTKVNAGIPVPKMVATGSLVKDYEGQLVELKNTEVISVDNNGIYTVNDGSGPCKVKSLLRDHINNKLTSITGVVTYEYNEVRLAPRDNSDIIEDTTIVKSVVASPSGGNNLDNGMNVSLYTLTQGAEIYYSTDGSTPTKESNKYTKSFVLPDNATTTIKAIALKAGLTASKITSVSFTTSAPVAGNKISEIQGKAHRSPMENKTVSNVCGVVTAINGTEGFYMQDTNADDQTGTSEGIYVKKSSSAVAIGDYVAVTGSVKEPKDAYENSLTETQIIASNITTKVTGVELPKPIIIGKNGRNVPNRVDNDNLTSFDDNEDAIDFYESLEGMLVRIENPRVTGVGEKYGEVSVVSDDGESVKDRLSNNGGVVILENEQNPQIITIDDVFNPITSGSSFKDKNYRIKVGDKFNSYVDGIMSYNHGNFKMLNTKKLPSVIDGGTKREVTNIIASDEKLTIASYNIENFSSLAGDRTAKIADSIVSNLKCPDIVGLVEIQDNNGETNNGVVDARETLKVLIDAIKSQSNVEYGFLTIDPVNNQDGGAPGGNIRPSFIYRIDRVSLSDKLKGDATTAVKIVGRGTSTELSLNPGRIDPTNAAFDSSRKPLVAEFMFKGEKIYVIANHLNSKGGDAPIYGSVQPANLVSEVQRVKQATIINGFVKKLLEADPKANIVALGDMNDFQFSNPLKILKGNELTNMIDVLPIAERHSYVYGGNSQVIDHILVSNNIKNGAKVDLVNINSEFLEVDGRVSDHDPVLVQLVIAKNPKLSVTKNEKTPKKFKAGEKVKVDLVVNNTVEVTKAVKFIVAIYEKSTNKMIDIKIDIKNINANTSGDFSGEVQVPNNGQYIIKYFLWDDSESKKPIINSQTLYQEN